MTPRMLAPLFATATLCAIAGSAAAADRSHDTRLAHGETVSGDWKATAHFGRLETLGPDEFDFTTGKAWQVRAEGDPRAVAALRFYVEDGRLTIGREPGAGRTLGKALIHVTAPALREAGMAGPGQLNVDALAGDAVTVEVAGSGSLEVRTIAAARLHASVAGSGRMTLAGRSDEAKFSLAGSGRLDGRTFATREANASVAGSGGLDFRASGAVRASIVGSGGVSVTGTTDCRASRIGSGRLRCSA